MSPCLTPPCAEGHGPGGHWLASAALGDPPGLRESGRARGSSRSHLVPAQSQTCGDGPRLGGGGLSAGPGRAPGALRPQSVPGARLGREPCPVLTAVSLSPPVTCAHKVFQVSGLPEPASLSSCVVGGVWGPWGPLHPSGSTAAVQGWGLGGAAASPGESGVPQCSSWFPVNAVAPRGPEEAGQTPPSLLSLPGAGLWAGCSQGLSMQIQIKRFHRPVPCLSPVSKPGPGLRADRRADSELPPRGRAAAGRGGWAAWACQGLSTEHRASLGTRVQACRPVPPQGPSGPEVGAGLEAAAPPAGLTTAPGRQEAGPLNLEEDPVIWMKCGQGAGLGCPGCERLAFPGWSSRMGGRGSRDPRGLEPVGPPVSWSPGRAQAVRGGGLGAGWGLPLT